MSKFTPQFLDRIRDNVTLSDIIRQRMKLTRAGREFKGCCPFHKEKTPSFYVNDDKQFYHCFGCGAHGDAIRFIVEHDNVPFPEAVEQLADKAGVAMPVERQQTAADYHFEQVRKGLYELMEDAAHWFTQQLYAPENKTFLDYLTDRGASNGMLSSFMTGCAPMDGQALPTYLRGKGYDDAQMIEAGLCRASKKDGKPYAFFRERIMFPVFDTRGRVVTFGGRILPDHVRNAAGFPPHSNDFVPPKYINGADSSLFNKSATLYGAYQVRKASREGHTPVVVEGYLDVIACHEAGFRGAIAPMGTALTDEQIQTLWKIGAYNQKTPILCFDGDGAGKRAAMRAMERILPHVSSDRTVKIAFMPEGEDPDSYIKAKGEKALREVFRQAMSLADFLWDSHVTGKRFDAPEERAALEKALHSAVDAIADESTKSYYRRDVKDRLYKLFSSFKKKDFKGRDGKFKNNTQPDLEKYRRQAVLNLSGEDESLVETLQTILVLSAIKFYPLLERFYDVMAYRPFRQGDMERLKQTLLDLDIEDYSEDMSVLHTQLEQGGYGAIIRQREQQGLYLHAPWLKPDGEEHDAIKGWDGTVARLNALAHKAALAEATKALEKDFTEENADRLVALQKMNAV